MTYDTVAPALGTGDGHPEPGRLGRAELARRSRSRARLRRLSKYVVRRGGQTSPPADPAARHGICTVTLPAATGCLDSATESGTIYGYSVFAIDAAGNVTRQIASARALDTLPPDPVTGFRGRGRPDQRPPRLERARASGQRTPTWRATASSSSARGIKQPDESARRH